MLDRRSLLKSLAGLGAALTALAKRPTVEAVEPTCLQNEWCFNYGCLDPESNICHIRQDDADCMWAFVTDFYPDSTELNHSTRTYECVPYSSIDWSPV